MCLCGVLVCVHVCWCVCRVSVCVSVFVSCACETVCVCRVGVCVSLCNPWWPFLAETTQVSVGGDLIRLKTCRGLTGHLPACVFLGGGGINPGIPPGIWANAVTPKNKSTSGLVTFRAAALVWSLAFSFFFPFCLFANETLHSGFLFHVYTMFHTQYVRPHL